MSGAEYLEIRLLGRLEVSYGDRRLTFPTRHAGFLMALLALEDGPLSREVAAARLWGERGDTQARASLRQTLYHVQKVLSAAGAPELKTDRLSIELSPNHLRCDALEVLDGIESDPAAATKRLPALLLGDVGRVDPAFEDWLAETRGSFEGSVADALSNASEGLHAKKDWRGLEKVSATLLTLDPFDETALRNLIEALARTDRRARALARFDQFQEQLLRELDVRPETATEDLRASIASGDVCDTDNGTEPDPPRERRSVSVLVIEGTDYGSDPEDFAVAASQHRTKLEHALENVGALVLQGTGAMMLCVFGASGEVERHAEAAVSAGEALATEDQGVKLAVVSGMIVAADDISTATLAHLVAEASTLLHDTAVGELRLSEGAKLRLPDSWDLARFVARESELAELESARRAAEGGRTQVVGLDGDAGLGKSTLLRRFLAQDESARQYLIEGLDRERMRSFGALARFFASVLQTEPDALHRAAAKGIAPSECISVVDELIGVAPLDPTRSATQRRRLLFAAASAIVLDSAESELTILAVEDVHWLDRDCAEFLDQLIVDTSSERLLIITTFRPELRTSWIGRSSFRLIRLEPLPPKDAARLVSPWIDGTDDETLQQVLARGEGNPFFLVEIAKGTEGEKQDDLPTKVQDVLSAQLHRRAADDRKVLQAASVVGAEVSHDVLLGLSGLDDQTLDASLSRLRRDELMLRRGSSTCPQHVFRHALLQEAAYASIPKAEVKGLHLAALQILARDPKTAASTLAEHAARAESWPEALKWWREAGDQFAQLSSYELSATAYKRAVEALERQGKDDAYAERIDLALRIRPVLVPLGRFDEVLAELDIAEAAAEKSDDKTARCAILIGKSYLFSTHGRLRDAADLARHAGALASLGAQQSFEAKLAEAQARSLMGDWSGTLDLLLPTVPFWDAHPTERFGHTGTRAVWCHGHLSNVYCLNGQFQPATTHAERAFDIATETGRPLDLVFALHRLARIQLALGSPDDAMSLIREALQMTEDTDAPIFRSWFACDAVPTLVAIGHTDEAQQMLDRQLEAARSLDILQFLGWLTLRQAELSLLADTQDSPQSGFEAALSIAQESGDLVLETVATRRLESDYKKTGLPLASTSNLLAAERGLADWVFG